MEGKREEEGPGWGGSPPQTMRPGLLQFPAWARQCPPWPGPQLSAVEKRDRRQQLASHHPKNNPLAAVC